MVAVTDEMGASLLPQAKRIRPEARLKRGSVVVMHVQTGDVPARYAGLTLARDMVLSRGLSPVLLSFDDRRVLASRFPAAALLVEWLPFVVVPLRQLDALHAALATASAGVPAALPDLLQDASRLRPARLALERLRISLEVLVNPPLGPLETWEARLAPGPVPDMLREIRGVLERGDVHLVPSLDERFVAQIAILPVEQRRTLDHDVRGHCLAVVAREARTLGRMETLLSPVRGLLPPDVAEASARWGGTPLPSLLEAVSQALGRLS